MQTPIVLTLAHSPDPDDVFMWWPLTGKVALGGTPLPGPAGRPALDTGTLSFRSIPADIEVLNRRAADPSADHYDITALSVRAWADVRDDYIITRCGASFGDGFGPKLVRRGPTVADPAAELRALLTPGVRIAVPGRRTTAFMMLGMVLRDSGAGASPEFLEMPFDQIIPAVARGDAEAGLVIHEGQLTFADAGLSLLIDVGAWWKTRTNLKLPLGVNAVRRDLDVRFGPGTLARVGGLLRASVRHAMERREESTAYTMPWAAANAAKAGAAPPTIDRVDTYCRMYVSPETLDMGEPGRAAIARLLAEGCAAGLCPPIDAVDLL